MRWLKVALLLLLMVSVTHAAVTPNSIVTPQTPTAGVVQFLQGTDTAGVYKTLYTAGANGAKCYSLGMSTSDATTAHLVTIEVVVSAVKYGGVAITTVLGAGYTSGIPPQNVFAPTIWPSLPVDSDGNRFLFLASGQTLQVTYATALTASTVINLRIQCAEF